MADIISNIRVELLKQGNLKTQEGAKRFFKEEIECYGVKTEVVTKIAKKYFVQIKGLSNKAIFNACEELFRSGIMEESFVACHWSYAIRAQYEEQDIFIFERWLNTYVNNWATCDTFCNHSVGTLVEMYPTLVSRLKKWACSKNRWVKRGAAVSLIIPARHGLFQADIFEIADILLLDTDDLVQKGYGWMLKAASQFDQKKVFEYVMAHKNNMPRTALRYAIEKMPLDLKKQAMTK